MGTGETLVELTNCDLVLSGAGITFYSAFVYVAWRKMFGWWKPTLTKVKKGKDVVLKYGYDWYMINMPWLVSVDMINIYFAEFPSSRSMKTFWQSNAILEAPKCSVFMETTPGDFREDIPHKDTNIWVNETIFYSHISIDVRSVDTFWPCGWLFYIDKDAKGATQMDRCLPSKTQRIFLANLDSVTTRLSGFYYHTLNDVNMIRPEFWPPVNEDSRFP